MTKATKAVLITVGLLAVGGVVYAFTRKKKPAPKKLKGSIGYETEEGGTTVKAGSKGSYVEMLQRIVNTLHRAAISINTNCKNTSIKWPVFSQWGADGSGNIVTVNGVFDVKTGAAAQFYLARQEFDVEDLVDLQDKIDNWQQGSNQCRYPLA